MRVALDAAEQLRALIDAAAKLRVLIQKFSARGSAAGLYHLIWPLFAPPDWSLRAEARICEPEWKHEKLAARSHGRELSAVRLLPAPLCLASPRASAHGSPPTPHGFLMPRMLRARHPEQGYEAGRIRGDEVVQ